MVFIVGSVGAAAQQDLQCAVSTDKKFAEFYGSNNSSTKLNCSIICNLRSTNSSERLQCKGVLPGGSVRHLICREQFPGVTLVEPRPGAVSASCEPG